MEQQSLKSLTFPKPRTDPRLAWLATFVVTFGLFVVSANLSWLLSRLNIQPVPFSLQNFVALVLGFTAASGRFSPSAILSGSATYVAAALVVGMPVSAGIPWATGGYLVGFLIAVWFLDKAFNDQPSPGFFKALAYSLAMLGIIYSFGGAWLTYSTTHDVQQTMLHGVIPFVGWDIAKAVAAAVLASTVLKR